MNMKKRNPKKIKKIYNKGIYYKKQQVNPTLSRHQYRICNMREDNENLQDPMQIRSTTY